MMIMIITINKEKFTQFFAYKINKILIGCFQQIVNILIKKQRKKVKIIVQTHNWFRIDIQEKLIFSLENDV